MEEIKNNEYFTAADREIPLGKKGAHILLACAALLVVLSVLLCGSILSFSKSVYLQENGQVNDDSSGMSQLNSEIIEQNEKKLEEFDNKIKEKEELIEALEKQISEKVQTPEEKLYKEELYDKLIKALFDKYEMCQEYSMICTGWSEDTRALLADSISEYEMYLALYKERLAVNYEVGTPDKSEIFSTSENIIDFIAGKAMLDDLKASLSEKNITLEYTDKAVSFIAEKSYSRKFGARNLRRFIQTEIEDAAAEIIIAKYDAKLRGLYIDSDDERLTVVEINA